jgi:hypothetical protein
MVVTNVLRKQGSSALAAALLWSLAGVTAEAQTGSHPSLEGVWKIATPGMSLKPVGRPPELTPEGRKHLDANTKLRAEHRYDDYDTTLSRCSNPGVPRLALTPMRFKVWQRQGTVTFDYEWNRALRQVDMANLLDRPDFMGSRLVPTVTGKSRGHWEGNTLVTVTTDLTDRTLLDDILPHSDDLKITERYRLLDHDTLEDRITIQDPAYYSKSWDAVVTYERQPDTIFPEDVCLDRHDAHQPAFPAQ